LSIKIAQTKINKILSGDLSTAQLLSLFEDKSILVRANAVRQFSSHINSQNLPKVVEFINNSDNRQSRLLGAVSLSFLGILALYESQNEQAGRRASELVSKWQDKNEKKDLIWFLESEGINTINFYNTGKNSELKAA
jgi:hypothetical protein